MAISYRSAYARLMSLSDSVKDTAKHIYRYRYRNLLNGALTGAVLLAASTAPAFARGGGHGGGGFHGNSSAITTSFRGTTSAPRSTSNLPHNYRYNGFFNATGGYDKIVQPSPAPRAVGQSRSEPRPAVRAGHASRGRTVRTNGYYPNYGGNGFFIGIGLGSSGFPSLQTTYPGAEYGVEEDYTSPTAGAPEYRRVNTGERPTARIVQPAREAKPDIGKMLGDVNTKLQQLTSKVDALTAADLKNAEKMKSFEEQISKFRSDLEALKKAGIPVAALESLNKNFSDLTTSFNEFKKTTEERLNKLEKKEPGSLENELGAPESKNLIVTGENAWNKPWFWLLGLAAIIGAGLLFRRRKPRVIPLLNPGQTNANNGGTPPANAGASNSSAAATGNNTANATPAVVVPATVVPAATTTAPAPQQAAAAPAVTSPVGNQPAATKKKSLAKRVDQLAADMAENRRLFKELLNALSGQFDQLQDIRSSNNRARAEERHAWDRQPRVDAPTKQPIDAPKPFRAMQSADAHSFNSHDWEHAYQTGFQEGRHYEQRRHRERRELRQDIRSAFEEMVMPKLNAMQAEIASLKAGRPTASANAASPNTAVPA